MFCLFCLWALGDSGVYLRIYVLLLIAWRTLCACLAYVFAFVVCVAFSLVSLAQGTMGMLMLIIAQTPNILC